MAHKNLLTVHKTGRARAQTNKTGGAGFDNIRENIDPHVRTKAVTTSEGTIQDTPTDEKDLVNKEYVDAQATRQAVELFLTTNASDIGGYDDLDIDVSPDAETTIQQTITAGSTTLINAFASQLNEEEINALEILESGIYDLHIHAEASFPNGMTIYYEFYHRTAGGVETLLGTSHDSDTLGLTEVEIDLHANVSTDTNFISGDRIVVKVYGRNTGAANKDITIHMEGDTVSRTEFPGFISPTFVPDHATDHEVGGGDLVDHDNITSGTIASHDTNATGTQLNTLTDNSMADTLHRHSELSASDGSPDAVVSLDANGAATFTNIIYADGNVGGLGLDVLRSANISINLNVGQDATVDRNIIVGGTVDGIDIATDVAANTTHAANNNQAHTDYLKNDADDSTTGGLNIAGDVGIGTTGPLSNLEVKDSALTGATITISNTGGSSTANEARGALDFYNADTSSGGPGVTGKILSKTVDVFGRGSILDFEVGSTGPGNRATVLSINPLTTVVNGVTANRSIFTPDGLLMGRGTTSNNEEGGKVYWGWDSGPYITSFRNHVSDGDVQGLKFYTHGSLTFGDAADLGMTIQADGNIGVGTTGTTANTNRIFNNAESDTYLEFTKNNPVVAISSIALHVNGANQLVITDTAGVDKCTITPNTDVVGDLTAGTIQADNGFTGSFTEHTGKTVTVVGGIITTVV